MKIINNEHGDSQYNITDDLVSEVRYDVFQYNEIEPSSINDTQFIKVFSQESLSESDLAWDCWEKTIRTVDYSRCSVEQLLNYYESIVSSEADVVFFKKVRSAISIYYREHGEETLSIEPSLQAIVHFIRFAPEISTRKDSQVYFDKKSECFGLLYKQTSRKKGTLNIIIKTNNEIVFSLVRKMTGVVKFTGRAYIGDSLGNSKAIKALFKMMEW